MILIVASILLFSSCASTPSEDGENENMNLEAEAAEFQPDANNEDNGGNNLANQQTNQVASNEALIQPEQTPAEVEDALDEASESEAPSLATDAATGQFGDDLTNPAVPAEEVSNPGSNSGLNSGLNSGSDPLNNTVAGLEPEAPPVPPPMLPSNPPMAVPEHKPVLAVLQWMSYEFREKDHLLKIVLRTKGRPRHEIFQEQNRAEQPEIVVRFFGTQLRKRMRRDIDASEFRSPVAYLRTRVDPADQHVDVVMTLRDAVKGELEQGEDFLGFYFPVPEKYWEKDDIQTPIERTPAEILAKAQILPSTRAAPEGSDPATIPPNAAPLDQQMNPPQNDVDSEGLPASFEDLPLPPDQGSLDPLKAEAWVLAPFSLRAVAQDQAGGPNGFDAPLISEDTQVPAEDPEPTAVNQTPALENMGLDSDEEETNFQGTVTQLSFRDTKLSDVLKVFNKESGNNFVFTKEVGEILVTSYLHQVPWDAGLKAILETYGLGMTRIGENIIKVDRLSNLAEYLKKVEEVRNSKMRNVSTKTLVMRLSNGKASAIKTTLVEMLKKSIAVDDRILVTTDDRINAIIVEATPPALSRVKTIVERLDVETRQVEITSRIVEVTRSAQNFLGIFWSSAFNFDPGRALGFGGLAFPNSLSSEFSVDPGVRNSNVTSALGLKFGSLNRFVDLDLLLKMEERKGTTNILQSNKIIVLDQQSAEIKSGQTQYFRNIGNANTSTASTDGAANAVASAFTRVDFQLGLAVRPEISQEGHIRMELKINSDSPTDPSSSLSATGVNTRNLTTILTRQSGETAVIGGIYDTKKTKAVIGIPFLSRIPIFGALFKSTSETEVQLELLVMVTPNLVSRSEPDEDLEVASAATVNQASNPASENNTANLPTEGE